MKVNIKKINVNNTTKFVKKHSERYPDIIYIEFYEGSLSIDVKTAGKATKIILEIAKEILENLENVDYTSNDPEEWMKQEIEVIKNAVVKRKDKLHDCKIFSVDIYYILDGYATGYFIAFHP